MRGLRTVVSIAEAALEFSPSALGYEEGDADDDAEIEDAMRACNYITRLCNWFENAGGES